jgi:uncharacterized repeat protein (TIGR01451 family)
MGRLWTAGFRAGGLALAVCAGGAAPVSAQQVPTGYQEYYVLGHEQHVWLLLNRVVTGEGAGTYTAANGMNSVVSAVASADGQRLYYDHWEDGLEADLLNPAQATTWVFGDGNAANGDACLWTTTTCAGDLITAGMELTLDSDEGLPGLGGGCVTPGTPIRCSVPVNPRGTAPTAAVRFDGGDRIVTSGGPISFVHNQDPKCSLGCGANNNMTIIGGATEVLSRQAFQNATSYSIPIGQNLWTANGNAYEPFQYVALNLVAFEDDTSVVIDSPGNPTLTLTLDRGEHFTSCETWTVAAGPPPNRPCLTGRIDGSTRSVATAPIAINAGTKVSTSGPISGLMFAAGDSTFATHFMPLLPDLLHGTDYLIPSVGDNTGAGPTPASRPTNHYLFNPDPDNSAVVTWTDTGGTGSVTIPPNSTIDYCTATGRGWPGCVPANSTVRLTSSRRFWGVTIHDHENVISDWSYAWLATRFLSTSYTSAFAPGTRQTTLCAGGGTPPCNSHNRAPVWVSATQDNTYVRLDLDGDGLPDFVDTDGDGCPNTSPNTTPTDAACEFTTVGTCAAPTAGRCVYEVDTLASLRVYDYVDMSNTGARIRANKPVAVVYGQDTDQGESGDETPDTGYVLYPALQSFLDPVFTLDKGVDRTTVPTAGGIATYTLTLRSFEVGPLTNVTAVDLLPYQVVPADNAYVTGSTLVTYPDLFQGTADPVVDTVVVGGRTRVRLTWSLIRNPPTPYSMNANETLTIRYRINLPAAPGGTPRQLTNDARASATFGGSQFNPTDTADVVQTDAILFKASTDDGSPQPGDIITYTLYVRNVGVVNETGVIVTDAVPADTTFVTGSITGEGPFTGGGAGTHLTSANSIRWGGAGGVTVVAGAGTAIAGTTLTFSGATATATTPAAHNWASGVPVTVSGAGVPYDGTFTITVTGANTFTYTMAATPAASSSGTATGPYRLTFQARINPGVADGTYIPNRGGYESVQTPYFLSNEVNPQVVGPALEISKSAEPVTVRAVTTLTRSGSTATVTTSVPHGWVTGEVVTIAGAAQAAYNGAFAITSTGASTFTYAVSGTPATPATGTITATGPTVRAFPNQVLTFHVRVRNTGTGNAANVRIDDTIPANTTYVAGSMAYSLNSSAFVSVTDAGDLDQGTVPTAIALTGIVQAAGTATATAGAAHGLSVGQLIEIAGAQVAAYNGTFVITSVPTATTLTYTVPATTPTPETAGGPALTATRPRFVYGSLGPGEDIDFRFQVRVNLGTDGLFVNNQATVSTTELPPRDTNLITIPIFGTVTITGHVWLDLDNNQLDPGAGEPDIASVNVVITDVNGDVQVVTTDANGNWSAVVPPGLTRANVDETDPDFPPGATETTAPVDGQSRTVPAPGPTAWNVGYIQPPVVITKRSSAGGTVLPGQRVAYTVTVTNTTAVAQADLNLADILPPGTTLVPGTAGTVSATNPAIRVTEYYLDGGAAVPDLCVGGGEGNDFANLVCTLDLAQNLAPNYFVIAQGSESGAADRGPNSDYAAVTDDPFGTGDFPGAVAADQIRLARGADQANWQGVVTVVECIAANCATDPNGFQLLDVQRVAHAAGGLAGTDTLTAPAVWADISRVMLVGGANGAGCDTADAVVLEHQACHPRLFPSGTNTINWTRNAAGAVALGAATSTVMVVQWGAAWNVQRTTITNGNAGGDGLDAAGEYNTAAIGPVRRAQTWVWGTGHTNDPSTGDSAEGVTLTLGNGVTQNPTESRIAAGIDSPGNGVSFDVYTLTHPQLAVDHRFLIEGNAGVATVDTTVNAATTATARMAIVYNGLDDLDASDDYPAPLGYARYSSSTNVQFIRRRPGTAPVYPFAAWLQGIDFSRVRSYDRICANNAATCYAPTSVGPSNVIVGTGAGDNGITLPAAGTVTYVYQVTVDNPLSAAINSITNTGTALTGPNPTPRSASVTDDVLRLSVDLEPNNTVFALRGTAQTFTHDLVNTGSLADSYDLTFRNDRGWPVELLDDSTGAVIAADSNGDGTWDCGCNINTGTVAPGASLTYRLRVAVPGAAPLGQEGTTTLVATSTTNANVWNDVRDEIRVLDVDPSGPVSLQPDNSGVVTAGNYAVYAHRVINNTGAAETFDLYADSSQAILDPCTPSSGWCVAFHWDANSDGVYTPGIDQAITNTLQLAQGASQLVFVVVNAPVGATPNTVDVTHLTARARTDPDVFDGATDTTTVVSARSHDLSGGGTRVANPGDVANHPGTLFNLNATTADRFELAITAASLFGVDALDHPTALHVDRNGDGVIAGAAEDTPIAVDTDGDGDWDTIDPAYNVAGAGDDPALPDVPVAAGATLAYELRRQVDNDQKIARDYVTFTARSRASGESDNVTGTVLLAAATRAVLGGVRVDAAGVVEFTTLLSQGTLGFNLYETDDASVGGTLHPLNASFVASPIRDSLAPVSYRVETSPVTRRYLVLEEVEAGGRHRLMGPFAVGDPVLERAFDRSASRLDRAGVPAGAVRTLSSRSMGRQARADAAPRRTVRPFAPIDPRPAGSGVKIEIATAGRVEVPLTALRELGLVPTSRLRVWSQGQPVPAAVRLGPDGTRTLAFQGRALDTDYTGRNVYVVTAGPQVVPLRVPLTRSAPVVPPGTVRIEKSTLYLPQAPLGTDPWLWENLAPEWGEWPYAWWDPAAGDFDVPGLPAGLAGEVRTRVRLLGFSEDEHRITARLNGYPLGEVVFEGRASATLEGTVPAQALLAVGNRLTLTYSASALSTGEPDPWASAYLDALELDVPTAPPPAPVRVVSVAGYDPDLPGFADTQYLIVTHPRFAGQAARIASLKQAEGLRAEVVSVEQAYDHFSAGIVEAAAIRALVAHVHSASQGRLHYVLLVGDDSFDPHDYVGTGAVAFVPSLLAWDGEFGRVPSENRYADTDGDGAPDVAIGRLPVQTAEEADVLVAKIAAQAEGLAAVAGRHLFVTDDSGEEDAPFRADADAVSASLPADSVVLPFADATAGAAVARQALQDGWQQGAALTHYFGHGGTTAWADEQLLSVDTVGSVAGRGRPTVLFAWACLSQFYQNFWGPSINEALLLSPEGGTLASFGPAGISSPASQRPLIEGVYRNLRPGARLGDVVRRAKVEALSSSPGWTAKAVEGFNLIGDPALRLP